LGWSNAAPKLTTDTIVFFLSTFIASFFLGIHYQNKNRLGKNHYCILCDNPEEKKQFSKVHIWCIGIILIGYLIEFIHHGGIPFFLILTHKSGYVGFGIPVVGVLIHTFANFYAIVSFYKFICSKNKYHLMHTFIVLLMFLMKYDRGSIIMTCVALVFVFLQTRKKISKKLIVVVIVLAIVSLYIFGLLGNLRSFGGDKYAFSRISNASEGFTNSFIPSEFLWTYMYISFGFSNFQYNVDLFRAGTGTFLDFIIKCILPDFISKRLPATNDINLGKLIIQNFNVTTIYTDPYVILGWLGPVLMFLYSILMFVVFDKLIPKYSRYHIPGKAVLFTIVVFNTFTNLWIFSGFSFMLVYFVIAHWLTRNHYIRTVRLLKYEGLK
jgi:oligosaccharide repeat unit polymerase